jgi:hypothetical protein
VSGTSAAIDISGYLPGALNDIALWTERKVRVHHESVGATVTTGHLGLTVDEALLTKSHSSLLGDVPVAVEN